MELQGKTILITRAASQSLELRKALEDVWARVIETPALEIVPVDDWTAVDRSVSELPRYDLLIFTSVNAVEHFCPRLERVGAVCEVPIAAVGSSTAERLSRWGLVASIVPQTFRAEGLLDMLPPNLAGRRILFPRAENARELLPEELRRRGAVVDVVTVYRTVKSTGGLTDLRTILASEKVDALVVTSPSAMRFIAETLGDDLFATLQGIPIAVIGPVAAEAVESLGLKAVIQPKRATIPDLVQEIRSYFSN